MSYKAIFGAFPGGLFSTPNGWKIHQIFHPPGTRRTYSCEAARIATASVRTGCGNDMRFSVSFRGHCGLVTTPTCSLWEFVFCFQSVVDAAHTTKNENLMEISHHASVSVTDSSLYTREFLPAIQLSITSFP